MPLYHDMTATCRVRMLHTWHVLLAAELLLALKGESYWERTRLPSRMHELSNNDINDDVIVLWALVRDAIQSDIAHDFREHRHGEVEPQLGCQHLHAAPHLLLVLQSLVGGRSREEIGRIRVTHDAYFRAKRDLAGLAGLRVVACRAKLDPDMVFARFIA